MDNTSTLLKPSKKIKTNKLQKPRAFIIDNLMNYSKSIDIISTPTGSSFILVNN